ncbi:hypothetical protein GobsT_51530 [Gemmata obscuriglobus]|uniref:Uncharacterized protein n=1 Tax=Gemmata obscuriglobus TaxID=114 RepID=A0A2Z3GZP7_9BACT|nr:hypothetical protein [Gemmata obscuriglobus]AWM36967.1 hypothetical protein C1280_07995 [Gemmata obscuriglobus]QEG30348.1 hypothetical protein GobsT_51530 [Gemmata obscuriglobus]VTS09672.1 unnamed protein product [Gemmata obscuriglobus UQM 2246]
MSLARRVRALADRIPPARPGTDLPTDPVAFGRGLLRGDFGPADLDPTHPDHTGWAVQALAFLGTLRPEHQAWLRDQRERFPGAYPDALLLPATDEQIVAALDQVMRRG